MPNASSMHPQTPQRRGGALEHLLAQFGAQQSATSATKDRTNAKKEALLAASLIHSVAGEPQSKSAPYTPSSLQQRDISSAPVNPSRATPVSSPGSSTSYATDSSEDIRHIAEIDFIEEARASPIPKASLRRARTGHARIQLEGLKMENRRTDRDEAPRRSTRVRKSDILASDTVYYPPTPPSKRKSSAPSPRRLDTARARLRDEIARKTQTKANAFIVHHKDLFLPLLPESNYITKLIASGQPASVEVYKRLPEQPKGVKATLKPYQLDGLSFLAYLHKNGFSGILADEMGLGKTLQTLSLFQYLEEQDRNAGVVSEELRPYLVICPLSVLNSWVNEAQKVRAFPVALVGTIH